MKQKIILLIFSLFYLIDLHAQSNPKALEGTWLGKLNVGVELRIVFHFEIINDTIYSLLDSPDQGANGIETGSTTFINNNIEIDIPIIDGKYSGVYDIGTNIIKGNWMQGGGTLPLDLVKVDSVEVIKKKQDPVKPYPYLSEEIIFENKKADSVFLAGTLTIPKGEGPFNAVVLVTGSGQQNRDEFLLGHSPFLVLSDYLTRKGIIVLRYDDRGVGGSSGDFYNSTSIDFAMDANAAVDYLESRKDLEIKNIGIAGHSEGGLIAPIVAGDNKAVDFIVLMAGPGIPGDSILNLQGNLIARSSGYSDTMVYYFDVLRKKYIDIVLSEPDMEVARKKLIAANVEFLEETPTELLKELNLSKTDTLSGVDFFANSWMRFFLAYDPRTVLEKTKVPVLAINGSSDLQVPATENLQAIEKALNKAGNTNFSIVELPGLNHLFQTSALGSPMEYATNEETFNEKAMEVIATWILGLK